MIPVRPVETRENLIAASIDSVPELQKKTPLKVDVAAKFVRSPVTALRMAASMRDPRLVVSYPLCRLAMLRGYLHGCA